MERERFTDLCRRSREIYYSIDLVFLGGPNYYSTTPLVQLSTTSLLIARKVRLQTFMFILTYYSIEQYRANREKKLKIELRRKGPWTTGSR